MYTASSVHCSILLISYTTVSHWFCTLQYSIGLYTTFYWFRHSTLQYCNAVMLLNTSVLYHHTTVARYSTLHSIVQDTVLSLTLTRTRGPHRQTLHCQPGPRLPPAPPAPPRPRGYRSPSSCSSASGAGSRQLAARPNKPGEKKKKAERKKRDRELQCRCLFHNC